VRGHSLSFTLTLIALVAVACQRQVTDLSELERSCESYCAKRFECVDVEPFVSPDPPLDVDDCIERCTGDVPDQRECLPPEIAYLDCLGELACGELVTFYANPYGEEAKELCFVEFEDASVCQ
jgi:hypothetical protein